MARIAVVMALLSLSPIACDRSPLADGLPTNTDCTGCHGQEGDKTPPRAVNGSWSTESVGVGAHQSHMSGSALAGPVACVECHLLPLVANGTDHPDPLGRPAAVVFGVLGSKEPASPTWNRTSRTCSGTYCHGFTLRGGDLRPPPVWTRVDGSQLECDSCHGYPPGGTHPQDNQCEACHGDVVRADGSIKEPFLHVDGVIQVNLQP
jgi:predicted CxxxxCH...CXXCH cytochrome family protein